MKEVGIKLKVGATGLENLQALHKDLSEAGVDTAALGVKAAALGAELKRLGAEQTLIDTFKRQKAAVSEAGTAMDTAKTAAAALGREIGATEAPTKKQEDAFTKARIAARAAEQAFQEQRLALQQLRTQMAGAGVSTEGLAQSQIRVTKEAAAARASVAQLETQYREAGQAAAQAGQASSQAAGVQVRAAAEVRSGLEKVGSQLTVVRNLASAAIGGQLFTGLLGDVTKTADAYQNLAARIKQVTGEGAAFDTAFSGVFNVATRTNSSLEQTGNLFARLAQAGAQFGVSQEAALRLTETINQSVQLVSKGVQASDAAIQQFIQSLQSGVLRGDEFNSIMEQAPRLAQALADGLGVPTTALRAMAEAGELSAQRVISALQGQAAVVQREFGNLPPTVGRALQNLSTEWTRYVGEVDKANGISAAAARAIQGLAGNLDTIGTALLAAGKAFAAYTALNIAQSFFAKAEAIRTATIAVELNTVATVSGTKLTADNTRITAENTLGQRSNAGAWGEVARALKGETVASGEATVATKTNTLATADNTVAKRANAAAAGAAAAGMATAGVAAAGAAGSIGAVGRAAGDAGKANAELGRTSVVAGKALGETGVAAGGAMAWLKGAGSLVLRFAGWIGVAVSAISLLSLAWDGLKGGGSWAVDRAKDLLGLRTETDKLAESTKKADVAARDQANAAAQLAQQTALAAEKALGLTDVSRKLVANFDDLRTKGTSAGEALEKLAKDLDLGSPKGINDAVTALDALEKKGKITGDQVRQALSQALDGKDLAIFETQARAAFDGTEQGARRLKAALDSVADESLKRVGTSTQELQTGFNAAMNSAMNDTDALAKTLEGMGIKGEEAGRLLEKSIDKEIEAAKTEKALQRVKDRLVEMGNLGKQSGDQVAAGLTKIEEKADKVKPGINSVGEAARKMGIQTRASLEQTADDFKRSWDQIRNSTEVTLAEKIKGFARYRDAAIAANGGVESSEVALQRQILETEAKTAGLGKEFERAMAKADGALTRTNKLVNELGEEVNAAGERINQMAIGIEHVSDATKRADDAALRYGSTLKSTVYDADKFALGSDGQRFTAGGQLKPPDDSGDWTFVGDVRTSNLSAPSGTVAVNGQGYWKRKEVPQVGPTGSAGNGTKAGTPLLGTARATSSAASGYGTGSSHTVNIVIGGKSTAVNVASETDGAMLQSLLKGLEEAARRAGA